MPHAAYPPRRFASHKSAGLADHEMQLQLLDGSTFPVECLKQ
jgi:hypothetical protein